MKGDFSRLTFKAGKQYSGVFMQQGRVQLDADWNELVDILVHRIQTAAADVIGSSGVPRNEPGFSVSMRAGLAFGGQGGYVYVQGRKGLGFDGDEPFTLEAWVKPEGQAGPILARFGRAAGGSIVPDYILSIRSNGQVVFRRLERAPRSNHDSPQTISPGEQPAAAQAAAVGEGQEIHGKHDEEGEESGIGEGEVIEFQELKTTGEEKARATSDLDAEPPGTQTAWRSVYSECAVPFDAYAHIAVTYDGQTIRIYINGDLVAAHSHGYSGPGSGAPLWIGVDPFGGSFEGRIGGVGLWRGVRTQEQLRAGILWTLNGPVDSSRRETPLDPDGEAMRRSYLAALWRFDTGTGTRVIDRSGNGNDGVLKQQGPYPAWEACALWLGRGRCYVEGILCETEYAVPFEGQPDAPGAHLPSDIEALLCGDERAQPIKEESPTFADGPYVVYLDVWQRFISFITDPNIREVALGGPDTTTRTQTVWQAYCIPEAAFETLRIRQGGALRAQRVASDVLLENQLYRVEIHDSGAVYGSAFTASDPFVDQGRFAGEGKVELATSAGEGEAWHAGQWVEVLLSEHAQTHGTLAQIETVAGASEGNAPTLTLSRLPGGLAPKQSLFLRRVATFKWSRDNGAVTFPIEQINDNVVFLTDFRQDPSDLKAGDWVEILDDDTVLEHRATPLRQVESVDRSDASHLQVSLHGPPLLHPDLSKHPLMRRWDVNADAGKNDTSAHGGVTPIQAGASWVTLEAGVQVQFEESHAYHTGDYWWMPARSSTQRIEWPRKDDEPLAQPPVGIRHHYAKLARLSIDASGRLWLKDLRTFFGSLEEEQGEFVKKSGDTMTGPLAIEADLYVRDTVYVGRDLRVQHTISGHLAPGIVGTPQLQDRSVTPEKLAVDVDEGVPPGYFILGPTGEHDEANGYEYTGSFIEIPNAQSTWVETPVMDWPEDAGLLHCITLDERIYGLFESGDFGYFSAVPTSEYLVWMSLKKLKWRPRKGYGMAVLKGNIYVVGGEIMTTGEKTGAVYVYEPVLDEEGHWYKASPMNVPRSFMGVGSLEGRLHVLGGARKWAFFNNWITGVHEVYTPGDDPSSRGRWVMHRRMPRPRSAFGVGVVKGKLYAIGGETKWLFRWFARVKSDRNEAYSPRSGWRRYPSMPVAKSHVGVVVVHDKIYAIGGAEWLGPLTDTAMFDPRTEVWLEEPPLHHARRSPAVGHLQDTLYALDGFTEGGLSGSIERRSTRTVYYIHRRLGRPPPAALPPASRAGLHTQESSETDTLIPAKRRE